MDGESKDDAVGDPLEGEEAPGDEGEEEDDFNGAGEEDEWEELYANPLKVRFTQDKIHPFFYRRGPIVNVVPKIRPVMRPSDDQGESEDVVELVPPFTPIHCLKKGEELWSLDNRRLYAMQLAAMELWPQRCCMRILSRSRLPRHKFKTQYRKFNTTSEGTTISVCARYQQFDTWSWFERAVELEWYIFSQRLGSLLLAFEIVPVLGALLFRTGMTGFSTRIPLVVGFVLTFATDFVRQKVPMMERRICELHVQAVMDGEVRPWGPCWRRMQSAFRRVTGGQEDPNAGPMSPLQLCVTMGIALLLLLPYVLGIGKARLRSSLLSIWLGNACVLAAQLGSAVRGAVAAPRVTSPVSEPLGRGEDEGEGPSVPAKLLSPKGRD
mmetsp:Transcript_94074/g.271919  ORF Transcript_94074/g.271919 Transcript_94074/m.271919 type:complete len:381 (+) Transcript_94074:109-1251(+)